mmetsp:Transcript_50149/g.160479  ORF Transcript_50149/g.160479 Transcript_50149/m.160479 type:complete len:259 (-) Transcript_50149:7-783(-)
MACQSSPITLLSASHLQIGKNALIWLLCLHAPWVPALALSPVPLLAGRAASTLWTGRLALLEDLFHESILVRHPIARHVESLDDAILDEDGEALAPCVAQDGHGWRRVQHQVQSLREVGTGVRQEGDHRPGDALVPSPAFHDSTIIHAIDKDLIDTLGFQFSLLGQVPRHLLLGSHRREGTGQAYDNGLFAFQTVSHSNFRWREAVVHVDGRKRIPNRSEPTCQPRCQATERPPECQHDCYAEKNSQLAKALSEPEQT